MKNFQFGFIVMVGLFIASILTAATASAEGFDTTDYASVLSNFVNEEGMVDYNGLKANRDRLDRFVQSMADLESKTFDSWPTPEKIAFWIDAYNALTLKTIINHYPINEGGFISGLRFPENSIRQISGVWDSIIHKVMGESMTLDHIEHEILRKEYNEPRIHMALVCAAMGCPPLRNEPYDGNRLDSQLDDQSRKFLSDPTKFRIDVEDRVVYLSSIFDWFGKDFVPKYGESSDTRPEEAVLSFISRYVTEEEAELLKVKNLDVEYLDYDWSLNEQD